MAIEQTLSIIKPDGVERNLIGRIIGHFEENGLRIAGAQMRLMSNHEAEGFYAVHKERPFFGELIEFMTSGPVLLMVLEGENAVAKNRELMGATNPAVTRGRCAHLGNHHRCHRPSRGPRKIRSTDQRSQTQST